MFSEQIIPKLHQVNLFLDKYLIQAFRVRALRQAGFLYAAMMASMALGIGISVVNTRFLGPVQYGNFKFIQNLFEFIVSFLTLGTFYSGGRLLAQRHNEGIKRQLSGNLLLFASIISIVMSVILFAFSFYEESLFNNQLGPVIRLLSPLLFVFPFQLCFENILQGDNRIYELSIFRFTPKLLYICAILILNYFAPISLTSALALYLLSLGILSVVMLIRSKPEFKNMKKIGKLIAKENKTYGIHVYYGFLANVATTKLAGITIAYYIDNTTVGFYLLAVAVTAPLTMISSTIGTTLFKKFANTDSISVKATTVTLTLSISSLCLFLLFIRKFILFLYTPEYSAIIPLAYIISVGSTLRGLGDFINRFLASQGKGRELRNGAFANGISNVIGYTVFIYYFGVIGAALTKLISDTIYVFMMYFYYKKFQKKKSPEMNNKIA